MRVLVTGSKGHLGRAITPRLEELGHHVIGIDLHNGDVLDYNHLGRHAVDADACLHLAGLKYAPNAELDPIPTTRVNVMGTYNIARLFGPHMVLASTCKAADPETVYGCSKLVAERIALAAGGRVVRLVNVLHSPGSVTEIWNNTPVNESLPVCDATRLFIDKEQAMALLIGALTWPSGRYGPGVTRVQHMDDVAASLWPDRPLRRVPLRRGDRRHERLVAQCEQVHTWQPGVLRIVGPHDPATEEDDVHAAAVVQR